jgi:hypothetical protein
VYKSRSVFLLILACVFGMAGSPAVAEPAVSISNANSGFLLSNPPFTLGWAFRPSASIEVTALGIFDDERSAGLLEAHEIGLWNESGDLLAQVTVPAGSVGALVDQFRYVQIAGTSLLAGMTYTVGALYTSDSDGVIFPGEAADFATAAEVAFIENRFAFSPVLANPSGTAGTDPGYFGPNFLFEATAIPVPEPNVLMLTLFALAAVVMVRSRNVPATRGN